MKDKLSINIKIASRIYPLTINREEEEKYRLAAKLFNEVVNTYRKNFSKSDTQDILAMAAFQFVLERVEADKQSENESLLEVIKDVKDDIDDFLKEKNQQ